jgi:peroxiredoxin Q/BCP
MQEKHITRLTTGAHAPSFSGNNQHGKIISLSDFKGKKLIIYFYPKDDTLGCTAQSCNLRDNYDLLLETGYQVIGISADDEKSHSKFALKYNLPFSLIADVNKEIINAYDVWGMKNIFGKWMEGIVRTTFLISENSTIEKIITEIDTENHTSQILN